MNIKTHLMVVLASFSLMNCAVEPVSQSVSEQGAKKNSVSSPTPSPSLNSPSPSPSIISSPSPSAIPATFTFDPKKEYTVTMETNRGTMKLKLFSKEAPKAVENFTRLITKGYYNNLTFHRVIPDFMIQGGDPNGNGTGGESIFGKPFEDEFSSNLTFSKKGVLAMANSGVNTNGSQFFITLAQTSWLNNHHTIFGEITEGMNVLTEIGTTRTDSSDKPLEKVIMTKLSVQ
jgi:cyclophilin family peptidyl-prolyl cis-trans isomerase